MKKKIFFFVGTKTKVYLESAMMMHYSDCTSIKKTLRIHWFDDNICSEGVGYKSRDIVIVNRKTASRRMNKDAAMGNPFAFVNGNWEKLAVWNDPRVLLAAKGRFMFSAYCFRRASWDRLYVNTSKCTDDVHTFLFPYSFTQQNMKFRRRAGVAYQVIIYHRPLIISIIFSSISNVRNNCIQSVNRFQSHFHTLQIVTYFSSISAHNRPCT